MLQLRATNERRIASFARAASVADGQRHIATKPGFAITAWNMSPCVPMTDICTHGDYPRRLQEIPT